MAQETLNIVITADNKDAINNINQTIKSADNLAESLKKMPNVTNQATQSLTNLSRIAQDAPYGFIGIANNINPMLESFQRLQVSAGSTGSAIKAMVAGLAGPAGIGVAVGVASSLLVKFGDDISNFISDKLSGLGDAFNKEASLLSKSSDAYVKASTDINKLKTSFDLFEQGTITKDKFLKEFNSTLGDTIGKTTDLATAEKFLTDYADTYVQMTFKKAVANEAAAEAAKKLLELELLKNKPITPGISSALTAVFGNPAMIGVAAANSKLALQNGLDEQVKLFQSIRDKYTTEAEKLQGTLTKVFGKADITQPKVKVEKTLTNEELKTSIQKRAVNVGGEPQEIKDNIDDLIKYEEKQQQKHFDWLSDLYKRKQKLSTKESQDNKKELNKQQKDYERFAMTISRDLTDAFVGVWGAMQKGESVLQALGDMLGQILQKLIASIIQATIFAGIMSLIPGAGGGLGFGALFGKAFGFADGGIISKPTYGLVGEGGQSEAIMPLNKLGNMMNNTFQAGAMSGMGGGGGGTVTLRGQDLLIALNRTQKASNLKGQSISLA